MIQTIKDLVSAKADTTVALAKEIWGCAELSYEETKSAAALIAALKQEGFTTRAATMHWVSVSSKGTSLGRPIQKKYS